MSRLWRNWTNHERINMNSEKATHPAREVGQRWRCNGGEPFTLANREPEQNFGKPYAREVWRDTDGIMWVGWDIPGCMTLLSPAPQAEPCAPGGYEKCPVKGCPRWTAVPGGSCQECAGCTKAAAANLKATGLSIFRPDWIPPLPAAPVTAGARSVLACGCGNGIDENPLHHPQCPVVSKPATNDLGAGAKCGRCRGSLSVRNVPFEQGLLKLCLPCGSNLSEWMSAQSGTPCASPPGLMVRARLQFAPMDDSCLEDV